MVLWLYFVLWNLILNPVNLIKSKWEQGRHRNQSFWQIFEMLRVYSIFSPLDFARYWVFAGQEAKNVSEKESGIFINFRRQTLEFGITCRVASQIHDGLLVCKLLGCSKPAD